MSSGASVADADQGSSDSGKSLSIASDHHVPLVIAVEARTDDEVGMVRTIFRLAANGPAPPAWRSPPLTEPPSA